MEDWSYRVIMGIIALLLISFGLCIGLLYSPSPQIIPVVNKCPVVECPVTSEVDCTKEILTYLKDASVLKETLKRIE